MVALPPTSSHSSAGIAAELRRAIADAVYQYGDKLPPEREIARTFGASRTTVRKALRQLEERKFVERKVGSGTYVVHRGGQDERAIADITSPHELMDVRIAVEPHIVRLALMHGTARDIEAMGEALRELEQVGTDREHFTRWDERFHMALANATAQPAHGVDLRPDQRGAQSHAMEQGQGQGAHTVAHRRLQRGASRAVRGHAGARRRDRGRAHQSASRRGATGPPRRAVGVDQVFRL